VSSAFCSADQVHRDPMNDPAYVECLIQLPVNLNVFRAYLTRQRSVCYCLLFRDGNDVIRIRLRVYQ
jgi:hypothetical protein